MKNKIAITGAEGFIGSYLKKRLQQENIPFREFDRKKYSLDRPESMKDFLIDIDIVVHLAGANRDTPINILKTNAIDTGGLLQAMSLYAPASRIIFASSFWVYSNNSLYGLSKKMAEEIIEYYARTTSLRGTILRISNVYGPGGKPFYNSVIATFAHLIKNKEKISIIGDGSDMRDYIYVGDVIEAIIM